MVNLAPLFALGENLVRQAVQSGGTQIRVETRVETTPGRFVAETSTTYDALVVQAAGGAGIAGEPVPGVEVRFGDWLVVLTPDTPDPVVGQRVVVATSRDVSFEGREAKVTGVVRTSAGAVLLVYARPT